MSNCFYMEGLRQLSNIILVDLFLDFLSFPLWWYTKGLRETLERSWRWFRKGEKRIGFIVWIENLFVPMFGQYDMAGRVISFFVRLLQIFFRGIALFLWGCACIFFIIFWLLLLPGIVWLFFRHILVLLS